MSKYKCATNVLRMCYECATNVLRMCYEYATNMQMKLHGENNVTM